MVMSFKTEELMISLEMTRKIYLDNDKMIEIDKNKWKEKEI